MHTYLVVFSYLQADAISPVDVENDQGQGNSGKNETEFRGSKTDSKYVKEYEVLTYILIFTFNFV